MKKTLLVLALIGILIVPMLALAQAPQSCTVRNASDVNNVLSGAGAACIDGATNYDATYGGVNGAQCCLFSTILNVVNWLFMAIMIIVVILILLGAFTLITASGSEEGVKKGRNYIVFALVGVAVALLARALPYLIRSIMGI